MANLRNIQFLRNASLYASLEAAKSALTTKAAELLDGSPVAGRYKVQTGTTEAEFEVRSILGIVYNGTLSFLLNEKEIASALDGLDYSGITTSDAAVVTNVTEADGKISATSENVGNLVLTDYAKGSDSGSVEATDSINAAVAKLENQIDAEKDARAAAINALDYTGYTLGDSEVFATITEENGVIAATGKNISGIKLAGYEEAAAVADVATGDTLGQALGKLQKTIHEMDKAASAEDGKVVTTVSEVDGVVSETKANVKDLQLGGYAKTNDTGDIASADTINVALSKLENQIGANEISNADGSINVTPAAGGTDINVNIKSGEKVIKLDGEGNGIYTDIKLSGITPSSTNVREEYALIASDGTTQLGASIKVYKDSSLTNIYIGHVDDTLTNADASGESVDTAVTDGTGDTALVYIMHLENDKYKLAAVNVQAFLEETEFGSGVTATNHVVHGVVDSTSETFLTVGADGFKLSGVQDAIGTAISGLDASVSAETTSKHVSIKIDEVDGKLTAVTLTDSDIASATALTQEISDREAGDTALSNRLGESVTSSNTAAAQLAALSGNSSTDTSATTSVEGAKRYAEAIAGELNSDTSGSSTHMTVGVKEESGVITAVTVSESNIANADDLAGLSGKTVTAITSNNGSITANINDAAGNKSYNIETTAGQISGLTAVANVAGEISGVSTTDSVQTAVENLYASLAAEIAARKAAISSTTINGSDAINVSRSDSGDTVSLILDDSTVGTGSEKTGSYNALSITNDGLFLSTNWDCGTFDEV